MFWDLIPVFLAISATSFALARIASYNSSAEAPNRPAPIWRIAHVERPEFPCHVKDYRRAPPLTVLIIAIVPGRRQRYVYTPGAAVPHRSETNRWTCIASFAVHVPSYTRAEAACEGRELKKRGTMAARRRASLMFCAGLLTPPECLTEGLSSSECARKAQMHLKAGLLTGAGDLRSGTRAGS
jgi:hypothetical protein